MQYFTLFWIDGKISHVFGNTIEEAFSSQYSGGAAKALDWYYEGIFFSPVYNKITRKWEILNSQWVPIEKLLTLTGKDSVEFLTMFILPPEDSVFPNLGTGLSFKTIEIDSLPVLHIASQDVETFVRRF